MLGCLSADTSHKQHQGGIHTLQKKGGKHHRKRANAPVLDGESLGQAAERHLQMSLELLSQPARPGDAKCTFIIWKGENGPIPRGAETNLQSSQPQGFATFPVTNGRSWLMAPAGLILLGNSWCFGG